MTRFQIDFVPFPPSVQQWFDVLQWWVQALLVWPVLRPALMRAWSRSALKAALTLVAFGNLRWVRTQSQISIPSIQHVVARVQRWLTNTLNRTVGKCPHQVCFYQHCLVYHCVRRSHLNQSDPASIVPWWPTPPKRSCVSVTSPCQLTIQTTCTTLKFCSTSGSTHITLICSDTSTFRLLHLQRESLSQVVSTYDNESKFIFSCFFFFRVCVRVCACYRPQWRVLRKDQIFLWRVSGM